MKIFILTMEDPVYINEFIKEIITKRKDDIVGIAVSKGDRLSIGKKRSKILYFFSLLLITGIRHFIKYGFITLKFKFFLRLSQKINIFKSPSILDFAHSMGIKTYRVKSVNNRDFLEMLRNKNPDVIINQSQNIIKKKLLSIPRSGIINRHNALLPKNRGRLSPFWALYKGEKETGVSIHFVNEGIDSGDIIVQEKFKIMDKDNFNTIVKRNYHIAPKNMLKALDKLEKGDFKVIKNDDNKATYNTIPTFKQALYFRINRIRKSLSFRR